MTEEDLTRRIIVLSDGTGETAETCVRAILAQFDRADAGLERHSSIKTEAQLNRALEHIEAPYLVVYTFASEKLRKAAWRAIRDKNLTGLDLLYPALDVFSEFLKQDPSQQMGILHSTQAFGYFDRVEAIEYTVKHDDGMKPKELKDADLILVGVSRSSKTPTSIYLAHKGYKVANVPLVPGIEPPEELIEASKNGTPIVCLMLQANDLHHIRRARFQNLGAQTSKGDSYVDLEQIESELQATKKMAKQNQWALVDVTNKAIEETASEILMAVKPKKSA